jgi:hypothetical protein
MYENKFWDSVVIVRREHTASYEGRNSALEGRSISGKWNEETYDQVSNMGVVKLAIRHFWE